MILNIIIFKNKIIDCFSTPNFDDHAPEDAAVQLSRSLKANRDKVELVRTYRFLDMYYFGTFDDSTGEIKLEKEPRLLLDCSKVLGIDLNKIQEEMNSNA